MARQRELSPDMQAEQAFQIMARAAIERFSRHLPGLRQNWDAEALHQARVGLRQLVAVLDLFRPMLECASFREVRARVKEAVRLLGEARNLDIVLEAAHRPGLPALRSSVSGMRSRAYAAVVQRLEGAGRRHLAEDLLAWVETGPWRERHADLRRERLESFAARRLDKMWGKFVRKSGHLEDLSAGPRHKVRIAAKKLRYGLEFLEPLAAGRKARARRERMIEGFKLLQDALGTLNDLRTEREMAPDFMREGRGVAFAAGRLIGAEEARAAPLLERAAKAARKLRKRKVFWR